MQVDLGDKYEPVHGLGRGSFGEVILCKEKSTGYQVAIKFIGLDKVDEKVKREVKNHRAVSGHPNIVRFLEVFVTSTHLCIVMERAASDFATLIGKAEKNGKGKFEEDDVRIMFQQLISAVEWCHAKDVCHRDLKLENALWDYRRLLLCDFGLSKSMELDSLPNTWVGTPLYMAPEVYEVAKSGTYCGKMADVWSCGVFLYRVLVGDFPFVGSNPAQIYQRHRSAECNIPSNLSPECQDLFRRIFVADPKQRITIAEIKEHPWYLGTLQSRDAVQNILVHAISKANELKATTAQWTS